MKFFFSLQKLWTRYRLCYVRDNIHILFITAQKNILWSFIHRIDVSNLSEQDYILMFVQLQKLSLMGGGTSLFWVEWVHPSLHGEQRKDMKNWDSLCNHTDNRQSPWKHQKKFFVSFLKEKKGKKKKEKVTSHAYS